MKEDQIIGIKDSALVYSLNKTANRQNLICRNYALSYNFSEMETIELSYFAYLQCGNACQ